MPEGYDAFVKHGLVRYGTLNPEGYRQILELLKEFGIVKAINSMDKYADPSYQQSALNQLQFP